MKVDDRVIKILTAINVAGELDRIAMRGARYGFPGWVTTEETKRGTRRRYIEQRADAQAKAAQYLAGAKSAGELAGRTLALLLMAVYADENAVAQSNRAFHTVTVQTALPWAGDVAELIDELAGEKLPAALMDPVLEQRRTRSRRASRRGRRESRRDSSSSPSSSPGSTSSAPRPWTSSSSSARSRTASTRRPRGSCARRSARVARRWTPGTRAPQRRPAEHSATSARSPSATSTPTRTANSATARAPASTPPSADSTRRVRGLTASEDRAPSGGRGRAAQAPQPAGAETRKGAVMGHRQRIALTEEERAERRQARAGAHAPRGRPAAL